MHTLQSCVIFSAIVIHDNDIGTYKRLIAVINSWLSGNYKEERDGSNAPCWWKIVDVVADDVGGADPNRAKYIAQNWRGW